MIDGLISDAMNIYVDPKVYPEEWDFEELIKYCEKYFLIPGEITVEQAENLSREDVEKNVD